MSDMVQDLGGPGEVSANEKNLIRRAATLTVEAERLEKRFALSDASDPDDIDVYGRITGHLRRTTNVIRSLLAEGILKAARDGERDPDRLRTRAITDGHEGAT
jgi:hypothetical protein